MKGTNGGIQLQLYQDGYANHDPITVYATQDGTFSAVLFDGPYKLVTKDKNGPWVNNRDTIYVEVKGKTRCEVKSPLILQYQTKISHWITTSYPARAIYNK